MPIVHILRASTAVLLMACLSWSSPAALGDCGKPGQWLASPERLSAAAGTLPTEEVLRRLAASRVILLGEIHDRADDHRWQLDMLRALHRQQPDMAIGFEMFPRRSQPVLDRWVAGELGEAEFLNKVEWDEVWGYEARMYMPLFQFAREHKLPMLALNVDRTLVRRVGTAGLSTVPLSEREGVGQPILPSPPYRAELRATFDLHPEMRKGNAAQDDAPFERFVEAQILWDRAMAQGIADHLRKHPSARVVGILGAGHIRNGYGVPHQLKDLGQHQSAVLITLPSDVACAEFTPGLADAAHLIPPQPKAPPPRLGVALKAVDGGVMIEKVMPGSLAEQTGLRDNDVILRAAGGRVAGIEDVRRHVHRQPPGTWLPLLIRRAGQALEVTVKFPAAPDPDPQPAPTPASAPAPEAKPAATR